VPEVAALAGNGGSIVRALRRRRRSIPTPAPGAPSAPPLVTLDGGLGRLVDALTGRLAGRVVTAAAVESVRRAGPSWVVRTADAEFAADVVVLATPAHASARLLAQVAPGAAAILDEIPYVDVATITLAYAREDVPSLPTDGTGVLVPPVEGSLLVGCTWLSSKWPYLRNDDVVLLRCLVGRRGDDRFTLLADDALVAAVRVELTRMLGISAIPLEQHVQRWPAAMPQYVVGHADRLERLDAVLTELPGLLLTGAAYRGLGLAGCVAQASTTATVARRLLDAFPTSNPLETTPGPGTKE
jgi:oxygen-dependent protoporphyrinogen oxidase